MVQQELFAQSDAYERFMGRWSRQIAPQLVKVAAVGPNDSVLDIGSGTGALAFAVAEAAPSGRVTGVDPSSAYVRFAQSRASTDRIRFVVGDAQALEFSGASFDRTLSLLVMSFIPDPTKALREMIRVTRPGGVVAAAVWDYGDGMQMLRTFWDSAVALDSDAAPRDERNMPLSTRGSLAELWRTHGLQDVDEQALTIEMPFASFDDYWQPFLRGQGPAGVYTAGLAESARHALESRLREHLGDTAFTLEARAWTVRGGVT